MGFGIEEFWGSWLRIEGGLGLGLRIEEFCGLGPRIEGLDLGFGK